MRCIIWTNSRSDETINRALEAGADDEIYQTAAELRSCTTKYHWSVGRCAVTPSIIGASVRRLEMVARWRRIGAGTPSHLPGHSPLVARSMGKVGQTAPTPDSEQTRTATVLRVRLTERPRQSAALRPRCRNVLVLLLWSLLWNAWHRLRKVSVRPSVSDNSAFLMMTTMMRAWWAAGNMLGWHHVSTTVYI